MKRWVLSLSLLVLLAPKASLDAADAKELVGLVTSTPQCYDSAKGLYSVKAMWEPLLMAGEKVTYLVQSKACATQSEILCGASGATGCVVTLSACRDDYAVNFVRVGAVWSRGRGYTTQHEFSRPEPRCKKPPAK